MSETKRGTNVVWLVGFLDKPPQGRSIANGSFVCNARLVVPEAAGYTSYHSIVAWGQHGEALSQMEAGAWVKLRGAMRYRTYEKKDGAKVNVAEATVSDKDENASLASADDRGKGQPTEREGGRERRQHDEEDDLPF